MSSILVHSTIGIFCYIAGKKQDDSFSIPTCLLTTVVAILPDFDYILHWLFDITVEPRISHSLGFSTGVFIVALLISRLTPRYFQRISFVALFCASFSHIVLDFLVGVHHNPLLWPLTDAGITSPVGILPSAGSLSFTNYYMWRNFLIEGALILPSFIIVYKTLKSHRKKLDIIWYILSFIIMIGALYYSITLTR